MLTEQNIKVEVDKIIVWVRGYVRNAGAKGVAIGNSGGKDSAAAIAIAAKALGSENVLAVVMPCKSILEDVEDARLVARTFNVPTIEVDLTETYDILENEINVKLGNEISKDAQINIKPRLRMTTLYAIAQTMGYLVMGTGNLSESFVGYTTKWGDGGCDFNPIGNFTVEEVKMIGTYLGVPEKIVNRPPADGLSGMTDEEKMGVKYSQISEYINTEETDHDAMKIIEKMHKMSEHKRCIPPVYKVIRN